MRRIAVNDGRSPGEPPFTLLPKIVMLPLLVERTVELDSSRPYAESPAAPPVPVMVMLPELD